MSQKDKTMNQKERAGLCLWYDFPADKGEPILAGGGFGTTPEDNQWQQFTLPIGNSHMGAAIYGGIEHEKLTFNHKTLWNGGPAIQRPDYNGGNKELTSDGERMADIYERIQSLFKEGRKEEASGLCENLVGSEDGYGAYQSWGSIKFDFDGLVSEQIPSDYKRELDLENALAGVSFTLNNTKYTREYLASYPDHILAVKLTAQGIDKLNFQVSFPVNNEEDIIQRKLGKLVSYRIVDDSTIVTSGQLQDNQMRFCSVLKVITNVGDIEAGTQEGTLYVKDAAQVIILVAAGTDYKNKYPGYRTGETEQQLFLRVSETLEKAGIRTYEDLKERHKKDYHNIFGRVKLDLGQADIVKPTDILLKAYQLQQASEGEKRLLEVLVYQYGRYLTIQSSRTGDLPSNLQGVWLNRVGDENRVPWGCDYHMNVNLQMNYWPVYSANMAECAEPLITYVDSLREPGRVTAEYYYGIKSKAGEQNGFSSHTQNTPFGWTCPGWKFSWGWSPAAVPWILQNCWEYYEYTDDYESLRDKIYPMLREQVKLYDQLLTDSKMKITRADGTVSTRLVSVPTYSPEHGPYTMGNTYEQVLLYELYTEAITGAEILDVDYESIEQWKRTRDRLAPIEIGESGQVKEWYSEKELGSIGEKNHRHMSHLLGVYPGHLISSETDEYREAAIISLIDRGMESTGWGMGQRLNSWARLGRGNEAYRIIELLMEKGLYPNLWDAHPPFQIDGNLGYTSGVTEMLLQSNAGCIHILPALPDAWHSGSIKGLMARGNVEVEINWTNHKAVQIKLFSVNGGTVHVKCAGIADMDVTDDKGKIMEYIKEGTEHIRFHMKKGGIAFIGNNKKPD